MWTMVMCNYSDLALLTLTQQAARAVDTGAENQAQNIIKPQLTAAQLNWKRHDGMGNHGNKSLGRKAKRPNSFE